MIDLSLLSEEEKQQVEQWIEKHREEKEEEQRYRDAMSSDDKTTEYLRLSSFEEPPAWYRYELLSQDGRSLFDFRDEMTEIGMKLRDPRRPILMRGSRLRMIARYSHSNPNCANAYVERVLLRYLRRTKYTCFKRTQMIDDCLKLVRRFLSKRVFYTTSHVERSLVSSVIHEYRGEFTAWVRGKKCEYTAHQWEYINKLKRQLERIKKLPEEVVI